MIQAATGPAIFIGGPPGPANPEERRRWQHTAKRWRLLYDEHYADVWSLVVSSVGQQRANAWLPLDLSSNPFALAWSQLAALYQDEPSIIGPHPDVVTAVAECGWWSMAQRLQRDVLALREHGVLCELDENGAPRGHLILPHRMRVEANPRRPGVVIAAHWWEPDPRDDAQWVEYHIDPRIPAYWVTDGKGNDISEAILGDVAGTYPWRARDASPVQPVVLYHASETGTTWDPYTASSIVNGSLMLSLHYTHLGHIFRHAAWAQRYMAGVRPRGGDVAEDGSTHVVADAATVLDLELDEDAAAGTVQIGQWSTTADPEKFMNATRIYERRLIEQAVGGVEVTRETSDIRSGYSLAVGREAQVLAQERYAPVFRAADRRALAVWSALLGADRGQDYPTNWPTQTGKTRMTISGGTRPERDIEYSIPGLPNGMQAPGDHPEK